MSWSNPSPDEAEEAYRYYKRQYTNAANQKKASENREEYFRKQLNSATSTLDTLSTQKADFEERLEGIKKIIAMLEGNNTNNNVPNAISKASAAIQETNKSYKKSIRVIEVAAKSLETAFNISTVQGDKDSQAAFTRYVSEKKRLEQNIADLKTKITSLSNNISSLNKSINKCNEEQSSLDSSMKSNAYEMEHYSNFTH